MAGDEFLRALPVLSREDGQKIGSVLMIGFGSFYFSYANALTKSVWFPCACGSLTTRMHTLTITFKPLLDILPWPENMLSHVGRLIPLIFSLSAFICLVIVFVGCTSTSSPNELYFLRVSQGPIIRAPKGIRLFMNIHE